MRRINGMRACAVAGAAAWYLDERGSLRSWRRASHSFVLPPMRESLHAPAKLDLALRVKVRPPPIGCADWPAGRALLEVALRDIPRSGAKVLELGAGVGVTALGLAKASTCAAVISNARPTEIVATDVCEASLANLRENATSNGVAVTCVPGTTRDHAAACHSTAVLSTGVWDAAGGKAAVERLKSLGVDPLELTHVLGSDVMYHGFDDAASMESNAGLASTLAALLEANPRLQITLLLVDRFSGGAVAAVSQVAGVNPTSMTPCVDPAISRFEQECEGLGLQHSSNPVPHELRWQVAATQTLPQRLRWFGAGYWDCLMIYHITARGARDPLALVDDSSKMPNRLP